MQKNINPVGVLNVALNVRTLAQRYSNIHCSSIYSVFTKELIREIKDDINLEPVCICIDAVENNNEPNRKRELIKTRIVNSDTFQQLVRIDNIEKYHARDITNYFKLSKYIKMKNFDAVIVSDYNKGLVNDDLIKFLEQVKAPVFIDTKKSDLSIWKNIPNCFIKINSKEFEKSSNFEQVENLIVTEGEKGCKLYNRGLMSYFCQTAKVDNPNVIGAGDVFLAAFAIFKSEGKSMEDCLRLANKAAGLSVKSFATCEIKRSEVLNG